MVHFIYRNKDYPIDLALFNQHSSYFYGRDILDDEYINLISEYDIDLNFSDESITAFFNFIQCEEITITNLNVFYIHYLSNIYDIAKLVKKTEDCMHNLENLICYVFSNNIPIYEALENFISINLQRYITDDNLLNLCVSQINRIMIKYLKSINQLTEFDDEKIIIDFLLKLLRKKGKDISFLFSLFNFSQQGRLHLNQELNKNIQTINFNFFMTNMVSNIDYLNNEHNEIINQIQTQYLRLQQENESLRNQIEQERNNQNVQFQNELTKMKNEIQQNANIKIEELSNLFLSQINQINTEMNEKFNSLKNEKDEQIGNLKKVILEVNNFRGVKKKIVR